MLYWVFDLDNTLYQVYNQRFDYNLLKVDKSLQEMLSILPCKRIIFTNATLVHAKVCLQHMGIINKFHNVIHRDIISDIKPNLNAFIRMMLLTGIGKNDKCIFFEDNLSNLVMAKSLGWITVYIRPNIISHPSVDYSFSNINVALKYFINIISNKKKQKK